MAMSKKSTTVYEIMHMERVVAKFSTNGKVKILDERFLPYDLYFEEEEEDDIGILMNNVVNFQQLKAAQR